MSDDADVAGDKFVWQLEDRVHERERRLVCETKEADPAREPGEVTVEKPSLPVRSAPIVDFRLRWLTAPTNDALALQRPLPEGTLRIVAGGGKSHTQESGG